LIRSEPVLATSRFATACAIALTLLAQPQPAMAGEQTEQAPQKSNFEGAFGLTGHLSPAFAGASDYKTKVAPAGFVRWGRFTLTGSGGFTTRHQDEVDRGLGAELVRRPDFQVKLGLRYDNGRSASVSPELSGLGDVKRTVRARLSARWAVHEHWRLTGGISTDVAGRGGYVADLGVARDWSLAGGDTVTLSASLTAAGDHYLQAWHGVTAEQSARSGLPVFTPGEGLSGISTSVVWRSELTPEWAAFAGAGASRLLGSAAQSPLTTRPQSLSLSAGLVRRF
jgi:MipA family protein